MLALAYPGSGTSVGSFPWIPWSDPGYILTENNTPASISLTGSQTSEYLCASNFGFAIPTTHVIDGLIAESRWSGTGSFGRAFSLSVDSGANAIGSSRPISTASGSGPWYISPAGSSADRWGFSPTAAQINSSAFTLMYKVTSVAGFNTHSVDWLRLTVYYSLPGSDSSRSSASILFFT